MRFVQRDRRGNPIEALCPAIVCGLVIDADMVKTDSARVHVSKALSAFVSVLGHDRDAAKMVRFVTQHDLANASEVPSGFCSVHALRLGLCSEDASPLTSADADCACLQMEQAVDFYISKGTEVLGAVLVILTQNCAIETGARGRVTVLSLSSDDEGASVPFFERSAQYILSCMGEGPLS